HPVFSCSIIEQKQLNTWVSFQSAEQPLLGQFSVSGNNHQVIAITPAPWIEIEADFTMVLTADGEAP
ncbi:hypothetical protein ACFZ9J_31895, partial [Pseudomonas aeruginosa]|uniref:hypothetical protein n=1 Tax=Pseudomonas aeruginosa TaxID=287 RepID=UPI00371E7D8D